jgi:ABC-type sugar transport system permease subunit
MISTEYPNHKHTSDEFVGFSNKQVIIIQRSKRNHSFDFNSFEEIIIMTCRMSVKSLNDVNDDRIWSTIDDTIIRAVILLSTSLAHMRLFLALMVKDQTSIRILMLFRSAIAPRMILKCLGAIRGQF